jgi:hypothetical protein
MRIRALLPALLCLLVTALPAAACTNVFVARDDARLVGANLDCSNYFPRIWFVPPTDGQFGRYCYGTDVEQRIAEGGVNGEGLFIGVNALNADTGWRTDPALPDWEEWEGWYGTGVPDGILARCATVAEAEAVFRSHNLFTLQRVKFLLADRHGDSTVIEWHGGELVFRPRGDADFQVATNFVETGHTAASIPCERYRIARRLLAGGLVPPTVDGLRHLLSTTHLEFITPTVVSTVCDLTTGRIHVYYFHDFEQPLVYDLAAEFAAGDHGALVGDLVAVKPYVATVYEQRR